MRRALKRNVTDVTPARPRIAGGDAHTAAAFARHQGERRRRARFGDGRLRRLERRDDVAGRQEQLVDDLAEDGRRRVDEPVRERAVAERARRRSHGRHRVGDVAADREGRRGIEPSGEVDRELRSSRFSRHRGRRAADTPQRDRPQAVPREREPHRAAGAGREIDRDVHARRPVLVHPHGLGVPRDIVGGGRRRSRAGTPRRRAPAASWT